MSDSNIKTLNEMKTTASDFYKKTLNKKRILNINLAVQSLTMPQYAEQYKNKYKEIIYDHRSLATLGDSVFSTYVLKQSFNNGITMSELTDDIKTKICSNAIMNDFGKEYEPYLFHANNDLDDENKKSYATAFEAIIGYIFYTYGYNVCEKFLLNKVPKEEIK